MSEKVLGVYLDDAYVGDLSINEDLKYQFKYTQEWIQNPNGMPISVALPLQTQVFEDRQARPFFLNLLPEGQARREISQKLGISEENGFELLKAMGGECAGAISLWPSERGQGGRPAQLHGAYEELSLTEIIKTIRENSFQSLLVGDVPKKGIRLSLAGAQSKIPVKIMNDLFFLPKGSFSSSHILKPLMPGFKGSVHNEAFCMKLALSVGIHAASCFIFKGQEPLYITKRYDREGDKRLHQEDFCQALGVDPNKKYESEGGPNLKLCFELLQNFSVQPIPDRLQMLKWVIYNQMIGNADAHAKNISLLFLNRQVVLAPFYDLMCTRVYSKLTDKAAMSIGGENKIDVICGRNWKQFSEEIEIKFSLVIQSVAELANLLPQNAKSLLQEFKEQRMDHPILSEIVSLIQNRCEKALKRLDK